MNFRPELAAKVMDGTKTVTRRLVSDNPRSPWWREECSLKVGKTYAVCPGRGKPAIGRVRILGVERMVLGFLPADEARREGFTWEKGLSPAGAFERAFVAINGAYDPNTEVWRVEFEVAR